MVESNGNGNTDVSLAEGGAASAPKRTSADVLLRQLRKAGYTIDTFSVSNTGDYALADADWNYKDIPHLNVVHTKVRAIVGTLDEDLITTVNLQKVGGIPFPLIVVNYATSEQSQTYTRQWALISSSCTPNTKHSEPIGRRS